MTAPVLFVALAFVLIVALAVAHGRLRRARHRLAMYRHAIKHAWQWRIDDVLRLSGKLHEAHQDWLTVSARAYGLEDRLVRAVAFRSFVDSRTPEGRRLDLVNEFLALPNADYLALMSCAEDLVAKCQETPARGPGRVGKPKVQKGDW